MNNKTYRKHIGVIGGVGPQATLEFYRRVILHAEKNFGAKNNDDYPDLLIRSIPIPDFISSTDQLDTATQMLIDATQQLALTSPLLICIASNTVHLVIDKLQQTIKVPFLSMIDTIIQEVKRRNYKKVGILGTSTSIKEQIYASKLKKTNIAYEIPTKSQLKILDKVIKSVVAGNGAGKYKQKYIKIVDEMLNKNVDGIILGCTELPLAINYKAVAPRMINSIDTLAQEVVEKYYKK